MAKSVALALQGGGAHGAFTWGVLDRLLDEVGAGRLTVSALSGSSAGAINAALCVAGLGSAPTQAQAAEHTQDLLGRFWRSLSERAFYQGNALLGGMVPGFMNGFNLDWGPVAIGMEMASMVLSPYDMPLYSNPLAPLLDDYLPPAVLQAINHDSAVGLHVCATNVATNRRRVFSQPDISVSTLLASACLPCNFRAIHIDGQAYWDGGFVGNPALAPLVKRAADIVVVTVSPMQAGAAAPRSAREILDRINDINANAPLVLEMNAIHAVNKLLERLPEEQGTATGFKPIRLHLIRDDQLMEPLGFVGKGNASAAFLGWLFDGGRASAERWLADHYEHLGNTSSCDWKSDFDIERDLLDPALKSG